MLLEGTTLRRLSGIENQMIATVSPPPGRNARMTADGDGNSYIYLGDADSTLLAVGRDGNLLWRIQYPYTATVLPPLMDVGGGCLLYILNPDGTMNVLNTADGTLLNQARIYAGGARNTSPSARLLRADPLEAVEFAGGYLSMATLDGAKLGGDAITACRLG